MKSGLIALLLVGGVVVYLQVIKPRMDALPAETPSSTARTELPPATEKPPAPPPEFERTIAPPPKSTSENEAVPISTASDTTAAADDSNLEPGTDEYNKAQREKGLVLWKGEWMKPEQRAAFRKAEDDAKAQASRKPVVPKSTTSDPVPTAPTVPILVAPEPVVPINDGYEVLQNGMKRRYNDAENRYEYSAPGSTRWYYYTKDHHIRQWVK